jgi:ankyrin repeat protein
MAAAGRNAMPPLLGFARDDLAAEIRAAVADGADVNSANNYKQTALHISALHGNLEAMAALLECGADANAANERGMRPLARFPPPRLRSPPLLV